MWPGAVRRMGAAAACCDLLYTRPITDSGDMLHQKKNSFEREFWGLEKYLTLFSESSDFKPLPIMTLPVAVMTHLILIAFPGISGDKAGPLDNSDAGA